MASILFAEAVCVILFSLIVLLLKNKQSTHRIMVFVGFTMAYVLVYSWATETGFLARFPAIGGSDVAAICVLSALVYTAFFPMLYEGRRKLRGSFIYVAAGLAAAAGILLYNALTGPALARELHALPGHFATPGRRLVTLFADLTILAAFLSLLAAAHSIRKTGGARNKKWFRYRVASFGCYLAGILVVVLSDLFADEKLRLIGYALTGLNSIVSSFPIITKVDYSGGRGSVFEQNKDRSEWDSASEEFSLRLTDVMRTQAPYRDPDLTLEGLAQLLNTDPRRLSYHLNQYLSAGFPAYINEWRLSAVCGDLVRYPRRSILDIAFENGFNSKSTFNALFLKAYGVTPRQFRRENGIGAEDDAAVNAGKGPVSG